MPKFIIERTVPGAGDLSGKELQALAQKSNGVLRQMPGVQWQHSYVAGDRIYCVYVAPNPDLVREHARRGGFPADKVTEVATIIDPTTGE